MPYITNAQMLIAYDLRRVAQWLSDDNVPLSEAQILASTKLTELANQASSMINLAARVGERYSVAALAGYAAGTDTGGDLRRLCADITFGLLAKRRGYAESEMRQLAPGYFEAMEVLDLLRLGERVFDIEEAPAAGLPGVTVLGANLPVNGQLKYQSRLWGRQPGFNSPPFGTGGSCGCGS